jgi:3D (Asp-Asp-Asp) domain-containing protein
MKFMVFTTVCAVIAIFNIMEQDRQHNTFTEQGTGTMLTGMVEQDRDVRTFNVSAYDACDECCGEWNDGTYADGSPVGGLVVAASRDIPFGTKIRIPGYGVATVRDRGGAITEGCLDLYFDTHREALNFGRHDIECEILK